MKYVVQFNKPSMPVGIAQTGTPYPGGTASKTTSPGEHNAT
jgi:hypothetical protein